MPKRNVRWQNPNGAHGYAPAAEGGEGEQKPRFLLASREGRSGILPPAAFRPSLDVVGQEPDPSH